MSKEGLKSLLEIPQVVEIIKKCGLSSKMDIKKMLKTERRNVKPPASVYCAQFSDKQGNLSSWGGVCTTPSIHLI